MADQVGLVNFKGGDGEKSKALEKLVDVIAGGALGRSVTSAFDTWLSAKAQASSIRTLSKAHSEAEIESITMFKDAFGDEDGVVLARAFILAKSQQSNLDEIGEKALKYITRPISENPIDPDWKNDFVDKAKNISNRDFKEIWGKILAQEIEEPGLISKRTLDILYKLTPTEARLFETFCSISMYDSNNRQALFVHEDFLTFDDYYHMFNINYLDLLLMDEAGLIKSETVLFKYSADVLFEIGDKKLEFSKSEDLHFRCYKFTVSGSQLYKSIAIEPDDRFIETLNDVAEDVLRKHLVGAINLK